MYEDQVESLVTAILDIFTNNTPQVNFVKAIDSTIIEVIPHPEDRGLLIGRNGRVVRSIRNLIKLVSGRMGHSFYFRVIADKIDQDHKTSD